jgi:hypothetical protein
VGEEPTDEAVGELSGSGEPLAGLVITLKEKGRVVFQSCFYLR